MSYVNHSGGCPGADMVWETEGLKYGVVTIAYSFHNHVQDSTNPKILTQDELAEGWAHVQIADKTLNQNAEQIFYPYMRNLLSRNWFQVKGADTIFAVGEFTDEYQTTVAGGTGWAVQMAIDNNKPIFFFDQESNDWFTYLYADRTFASLGVAPKLTPHFAGIGTRALNVNGINAIKEVLRTTFEE